MGEEGKGVEDDGGTKEKIKGKWNRSSEDDDNLRFLQPPTTAKPLSWPARTTGLHATLLGSVEQRRRVGKRGVGARRRQ